MLHITQDNAFTQNALVAHDLYYMSAKNYENSWARMRGAQLSAGYTVNTIS